MDDQVEVHFQTDLGEDWQVSESYWINTSSGKTELQDIILQHLNKQANLMLLLNGDIITNSLEEHMRTQGLSTEQKIEIWFSIEIPPPSSLGEIQHDDWISCVQLTSQGCFVSDYGGFLALYNENQEEIIKNQIFSHPIKSIDFNENSNLLIASSKTGDIKIYNFQENSLEESAFSHIKHIEKVTSNPSGSMWAVGTYSGEINLAKINEETANIRDGTKKQRLDKFNIEINQLNLPHTDCITGLKWPSLDLLLTSSTDHSIMAVDLETQSVISSILAPRSIQAFNVFENNIAAGFENGLTQLYDYRNSQKIALLEGKSWVRAISMKDLYIAVGHENGNLRFFDRRSVKSPLHTIEAHQGKVLTTDWLNSIISSGGSDSIVKYHTFS
ncbi:unnamed protein product [Blepharisma stoltei]|uniref:Uncharacterized protein n=1 Tax=Blepharisma stoltei TaxID=1481888 RepID=A0AAU9JZM6_9CILI|nr:unnamed protein product [Blepharisma stoltei]